MSEKSILQLDIISDFVCPWCFIGKRKLDVALQRQREFEINIVWRPYRLDPSIPKAGLDRKEYLTAKFGPQAGRKIGDKVIAAASGTGINFNFDAIQMTPNTTNAHRLMRWAGLLGRQHQLADQLFSAYFEQGVDIGADKTLLDLGESIGFTRNELQEALDSDADYTAIDDQDAEARDAGVTGVPALLLGGKFVLMGAQDPDYVDTILNKAHARLGGMTADPA